MPIIVEEDPFWGMVARLREYEGWRCLWRLPVAGLLFPAVPLILVGVAVAGAAIAGSDFSLRTAVVSAVVVLAGTGWLAPRLARRQLHRRIIAGGLWTWEKPNPSSEVLVLLRSDDVEVARRALRRAKFNPQGYGLKLGTPPSDAHDLDYRLAVHEPEAWPQSASDADRTRRIAAVFERAGLPGRVGGSKPAPGATCDGRDGPRADDGRAPDTASSHICPRTRKATFAGLS